MKILHIHNDTMEYLVILDITLLLVLALVIVLKR